jgi:hypothetical protein
MRFSQLWSISYEKTHGKKHKDLVMESILKIINDKWVLVALALVMLVVVPVSANLSGNYSTVGLIVNGSTYFANVTSSGTLLYAVGRCSISLGCGVAEIDPLTNTTIFSWQDPAWVKGAGPESIYKYSNGNYLISDVDAKQSVYEMSPAHTKVWEYTTTYVSDAVPAIIDGVDSVILFQAGGGIIKIIRRDNQSVIKTFTGFNYANNGDFRVIGGQKYLMVADYKQHNLYKVNYDTGKIVLTYPISTPTGGPYSAEWLSDTEVLYTTGGTLKSIAILNTTQNASVWNSGKFGSITICAKAIYSKTKIIVADNTNIIKLTGFPADHSIIAPVASFTPSATTGTAPLAVTFTDSSTNTPTTWSWSFS